MFVFHYYVSYRCCFWLQEFYVGDLLDIKTKYRRPLLTVARFVGMYIGIKKMFLWIFLDVDFICSLFSENNT